MSKYNPVANLKIQMRGNRIPEWREEHPFGQSIQRRYRFDFAWPEFSIALEFEGGTWGAMSSHMHPLSYSEDCVRGSLAAVLGWKVVRCTSDMVRDGTALTLVLFAFGRIHEDQIGRMVKRRRPNRKPGTKKERDWNRPVSSRRLPAHVDAAVKRAEGRGL